MFPCRSWMRSCEFKVALDTFWSPLNFPATFDPEIVFDPYTSRWFFSAGADAPQGTNFFFFSFTSVLLAVSETSDPTGNWLLYRVYADPSGNTWADYPRIGFNSKWVVITANI